MINEQVLKKAIERAIKNGYNPIADMGEVDNFEIYRGDCNWIAIWVGFYTKRGDGGQLDVVKILFSHDFAKAFFPWVGNKVNEPWLDFLSNMVREKEPLKYLEKFLKGA